MNIIYKTIDYIENGKLAVLKLNRPEKRNAIDGVMIEELKRVFIRLKNNTDVVLLQLVGKGNAFCSGADISWLESISKNDKKQVEKQFFQLAEMFKAMQSIPQIIMSFVHGSVYGGGIGLMACSDFVISSPGTVFSFSEIKLGLIPATISPYVINRTGIQRAKQLFFTGERFDGLKALEIGLIDQVARGDQGDLHYETLMETLLKQPHHALKALKQLLRNFENGKINSDKQDEGLKMISELIASKETKELFSNFLNR